MSDNKPRPTGWTRAKQVAFLNELKATQSVSHAARNVGMGRQSAYKLRRRLAGQPFDLAWHMALDPSRLTEAQAGSCPVCGCIPPAHHPLRRWAR
jgi:hypothetical protein